MSEKHTDMVGQMPDEILARPMMGAQPQGGIVHRSGPWALDDPYGNAVRYVRADLLTKEQS